MKPPAKVNFGPDIPKAERLDDLVALSNDPHPRKTRRIEWVGEKSPLRDPQIEAWLLLGMYTPMQEKLIRLAAAKAKTRVGGARVRVFQHNHQLAMGPVAHLSRTYQWDPSNNFICEVDYRDVDAILGSESEHEFRDITDRDPDEPNVVQLSPSVFKTIAAQIVRPNDKRLDTIGEVIGSHE